MTASRAIEKATALPAHCTPESEAIDRLTHAIVALALILDLNAGIRSAQ